MPRRVSASSIGMLWMLITPNAARTPAASKNAATTSAAIVRSDIPADTAGQFDDRTGHVAAHGRREKGDRRRDFLRTPDATQRDPALAREFGDIGVALDRSA